MNHSLINSNNNQILGFDILGTADPGDILQFNGQYWALITLPIAGSLTGITNLGVGSQFFKQITLGIAEFRTLNSSSDIIRITAPNEVSISLNTILSNIQQINSATNTVKIVNTLDVETVKNGFLLVNINSGLNITNGISVNQNFFIKNNEPNFEIRFGDPLNVVKTFQIIADKNGSVFNPLNILNDGSIFFPIVTNQINSKILSIDNTGKLFYSNASDLAINIYNSDGTIPASTNRQVSFDSNSSLQIGQPGVFGYGLYIGSDGTIGLKSDLVGVDLGNITQPYLNSQAQDMTTTASNSYNLTTNTYNITCNGETTEVFNANKNWELNGIKWFVRNYAVDSPGGFWWNDNSLDDGLMRRFDVIVQQNFTNTTGILSASSIVYGSGQNNIQTSLSLTNQPANTVFASNGTIPFFRALTTADLPLNDNVIASNNLWSSSKINNTFLLGSLQSFNQSIFGFNTILVLLRDIFTINTLPFNITFDVENTFSPAGGYFSESFELALNTGSSSWRILNPSRIQNTNGFLQCEFRTVSNITTFRFRLVNGNIADTYTPNLRLRNLSSVASVSILGFSFYTDAVPTITFDIQKKNVLLANLQDCQVTSPTNGQVLTYDSTLQKWKNQAAGGITFLFSGTSPNVLSSQYSYENFFVANYSVFTPINCVVYANLNDGVSKQALIWNVNLSPTSGGQFLIEPVSNGEYNNNYFQLEVLFASNTYTFRIHKVFASSTTTTPFSYNILNFGYTFNSFSFPYTTGSDLTFNYNYLKPPYVTYLFNTISNFSSTFLYIAGYLKMKVFFSAQARSNANNQLGTATFFVAALSQIACNSYSNNGEITNFSTQQEINVMNLINSGTLIAGSSAAISITLTGSYTTANFPYQVVLTLYN